MTYDMFRTEFVNQFPDKEAVFADVLIGLIKRADSLVRNAPKQFSAVEELAQASISFPALLGAGTGEASGTYCNKAATSVRMRFTDAGLSAGLDLNRVASSHSLDLVLFTSLAIDYFFPEAFRQLAEKLCIDKIEEATISIQEKAEVFVFYLNEDGSRLLPAVQKALCVLDVNPKSAQTAFASQADEFSLQCEAQLLAYFPQGRALPLVLNVSETTVPPAPEPVVQSPRSLPSCADCRAGTCAIHGTSPLA